MSQKQEATQVALDILDAGDSTDGPLGITAYYSIQRLRLLAANIRKNRDGFTSEQVVAFLSLYGEELRDEIDNAVRVFLEEKLG